MLKNFSHYIANILLDNNAIENEDMDIYIYGLEILISTASSVIVIFILSIIFKQVLGTLLFLLSFLLLRRYIGGYHSNTYLGCFLTMIFIYLFSLILVYIIPNDFRFILSCVLLTASVIIIFLKAPQEHHNRPLSQKEKLEFRKISQVTVVLLSIIIILLFLFVPKSISFAFWSVLSITAASITLLFSSPA